MSGPELAMWWLVAALGLGGSMLCSGIETGLYATSSVRAFVRARSAGARFGDRVVASALDHPERSLTTLLLFNNAFNYLGTLAVTALLATLGLTEAAMVLLQAAVLTPILLVFAESLPKELFRANADRAARSFAPALHAMTVLGLVTGVVPGAPGGCRRSAQYAESPERGDDQTRLAGVVRSPSGPGRSGSGGRDDAGA